MSPDPLSPIAPISSSTVIAPALPLPEDRPVAAQQPAGQTPAAAATPGVETAVGAPAATPMEPTPDPIVQAMIDRRATAAARQTSLAPLFADLSEASAAGQPATAALPADVRAAVNRVLSQRLSVESGVNAQTLRDAVARSGLFLEANLAGPAAFDPAGDLKAALLSLRQALATAQQALIGDEAATPPAPPPQQQTRATPPAATTTPTTVPTPEQAATQTPGQTTGQAAPVPPQAAPATIPAPEQAAAHAVDSPLAVSQPSLLLAAQTAATPETADALLDPAIQGAQRAQQQAQVQTQIEALRQTAAAASQLERAAGSTPTQATPVPNEDAAPTPAQAAAQNAQALAQQAAAQAAQLAAGSVNAQRTISQSSLLLAAQAAAIRLEDDEPSPLPTRPALARETPPPVEPVTPTTPAPPVRGSTLAGQPPVPSTLPTQAGEAAVVRHLAEQVDQALARQALHQLASTQAAQPAEGAETAAWMFEIPIATPQGTMIAQFEIDRDGRESGGEAGAAAWRARFSLNFEPLGPVHVQLSQVGPRTAVNLWAEREGSLDLLHAQSADLARDLGGEVRIQGGAPQRPTPPRGQFVDRLT